MGELIVGVVLGPTVFGAIAPGMYDAVFPFAGNAHVSVALIHPYSRYPRCLYRRSCLGDSVHFREKAREIMHQFVTSFFAPLFFVSIGLKVDFIEHFDLTVVSLILLIAFVGKVAGAGIGARLGGMSSRKSLAVGFGLNARGAMEMILGTLAYDAGLINQAVFVAIIVMALVTSITSAPLMRLFLEERTGR